MSDDERYSRLEAKLDKILDKLEGKLSSIDGKLQNHEVRIVVLETHDKAEKSDWRAQVIMLLVKSLTVGAVAVASLVGAGGLLRNIFG